LFCAPFAVILVGWAWVALGYRLAFHGVEPPYGFYKGPQGPNLERWLFDAPMLFVLAALAVLALVVCRAWLRQRRWSPALLFFLECLACVCVFAVPVIWYIDIPGEGNLFI
jgi:cytochrome bd-type quinol oxidase subunit 2